MSYGQFVNDGWMVGSGLQLAGRGENTRIRIDQTPPRRTTELTTSIQPFFRRYWSVGPVLLFGGGGFDVNVLKISTKYENGPNDEFWGNRNTVIDIKPSVMAGGTYFLSNRLGLQGIIRGAGLPLGTGSINLGLVYWTGPNGTGVTNPEHQFTTTKARNWVIGGGFGINVSGGRLNGLPETQSRTLIYSVSPSVGYFVRDNTLLGLDVSFGMGGQLVPKRDGAYQHYSIAPSVQRYLSNRRLTPYMKGTVLIGSGRSTNSDVRDPLIINASLGAGLAYRLNNRLLIETSLANLYYNQTNRIQGNRIRGLGFAAQLGSGFSLRYVLASKKS